ncbi:MAG: alpha/beta family hydrolase, partial [Planctomycetota bacterium]
HEADDLSAALDYLEERFPNAELWAGGFSFGARTTAAHVLRDDRVKRVVLVAVPVTGFDCAVIEDVTTPGYVVQAGRDQFGNLADLKRLYPNISDALELDEIPDVEHFFQGKTRELEERVRNYASGVLT